jgi:FkbM family methyltransferase
MINKKVSALITAYNISPVLVDIGASAGTNQSFAVLAPYSTLVGFDPDSRGLDQNFGKEFKKAFLIPKAVINRQSRKADFYLTKFNECSSILKPNPDVYKEYIISEYFTPIGTASVMATSLNAAIDELELSLIDWLKVDSQGTDLSLITSLRKGVLADVLVIDMEPGLMPFYRFEETFPQCHEYMIKNGFFPSHLQSQSFARVRSSTVEVFREFCPGIEFDHRCKKSPICLEARYFRTIRYLEQRATKARLLTAFVLAMAEELIGYAMDICLLYERKEGRNEASVLMREAIQEELTATRKKEIKVSPDMLSMRDLASIALFKIRRRLSFHF